MVGPVTQSLGRGMGACGGTETPGQCPGHPGSRIAEAINVECCIVNMRICTNMQTKA